jgi:hypothetical protein
MAAASGRTHCTPNGPQHRSDTERRTNDMIKLPDEIRFGIAAEHDDDDEIRPHRFRVSRDAHDPANSVDAHFELDRSEQEKLRRILEDNAAHPSPDGNVDLVFELPTRVIGALPPDPMGPALYASVNYLNALAPVISGSNAAVEPLTAETVLTAMLRLRGEVLAGFSGQPIFAISAQPIPERPDNIVLPDHPGLEAQANRLLMAAWSTALVIDGTTSFTTTGYSAALGILNVVHAEFTP